MTWEKVTDAALWDVFVADVATTEDIMDSSFRLSVDTFADVRDEDDPPALDIAIAIYCIALKGTLWGHDTGHRTTIAVASGVDVEIVVLDRDGATVAYHITTSTQDEAWKVGTIQDAVQAADCCAQLEAARQG